MRGVQIHSPILESNQIVLFRLVTSADAANVPMQKPTTMMAAPIGERRGSETGADGGEGLGDGLAEGIEEGLELGVCDITLTVMSLLRWTLIASV
jgi:hypothetical protein